jgi:hypothetical protein
MRIATYIFAVLALLEWGAVFAVCVVMLGRDVIQSGEILPSFILFFLVLSGCLVSFGLPWHLRRSGLPRAALAAAIFLMFAGATPLMLMVPFLLAPPITVNAHIELAQPTRP